MSSDGKFRSSGGLVPYVSVMTGLEFSDARRMERVGELLARAVSRKVRRDTLEAARRNQPAIPDHADPILIFISKVGEASPKEIRERFALSRSTAFRRLDALVTAGQLSKHGNTKRIRYRFICGIICPAA
jgi:predicted HTH transcriptional regulator